MISKKQYEHLKKGGWLKSESSQDYIGYEFGYLIYMDSNNLKSNDPKIVPIDVITNDKFSMVKMEQLPYYTVLFFSKRYLTPVVLDNFNYSINNINQVWELVKSILKNYEHQLELYGIIEMVGKKTRVIKDKMKLESIIKEIEEEKILEEQKKEEAKEADRIADAVIAGLGGCNGL